jgi:hypothetical protein
MIHWTASADKWGIPHQDASFAIQNAQYVSDNVKVNEGDPSADRRVIIGAQHKQTSRLIEVLLELRRNGDFVVYHVMPLGSHYKRQMEEDQ